MSDSKRAGALLPQVLAAIGTDSSINPTTLLIQKTKDNRFNVEACKHQGDFSLDLDAIQHFIDELSTGLIDLASVFERFSNEELVELLDLKVEMAIHGIMD
jgi:hypothetical protein